MKSFYFHLVDGADLLLDPDGRRLPSLGAVAAAALAEARAIIGADAAAGLIRLDQAITVENDVGEVIYRLPFADAVPGTEDLDFTHSAVGEPLIFGGEFEHRVALDLADEGSRKPPRHAREFAEPSRRMLHRPY